MPKISTSPFPTVAALPSPGAGPTQLDRDWSLLPDPAKARILEHLDVPGMHAFLTEGPEGFGTVVSWRTFDHVAANTIAHLHDHGHGGLQALVDTYVRRGDFASPAGRLQDALAKAGHKYAALLINECAVCERLPSVSTAAPAVTWLPGRLLGSQVVLTREGPALLVHPTAGSASKFSFLSTEGTRTSPAALRGLDFVPDAAQFRCTVMRSAPFLGQGPWLVVRDPIAGTMSLYDPWRDALRSLPDDFAVADSTPGYWHQVFAALSGNGRFVAATFRMGDRADLLVHDLWADRTVRRSGVPRDVAQVSVGPDGGVLLACGTQGLKVPAPLPEGHAHPEEQIVRTRLDARQVNYRFHPNGFDSITNDATLQNIRLQWKSGKCVTLVDPVGSRNEWVRSLAVSPANTMMAVLRSHATLSLYDLVDTRDGELVEPKLQIRLPARHMGGDSHAVAWFDADGAGINVAFTADPPARTWTEIALVHLPLG